MYRFFPNAFHGDRVGLSRDLSNKPNMIKISQTGQHTPKTGFQGDSTCLKKTILFIPIKQNKTVNGRHPVVVWNPYKKNYNIRQDIKSFCKPIHAPKSTMKTHMSRTPRVKGIAHIFHSQFLAINKVQPKPQQNSQIAASMIRPMLIHWLITTQSTFSQHHNAEGELFHMKSQYVAKIRLNFLTFYNSIRQDTII